MEDIYSKSILEFVTVSIEYCAFMEKSGEKDKQDFLKITQRLLPLMYLKTSLITKPSMIMDLDEHLERFVTEGDYEVVRMGISEVLGADDDYFDEEQPNSIAEDLSDVYQALKDFTLNYKEGKKEVMNDALAECLEQFELHWGGIMLRALKAIHHLCYTINTDEFSGISSDDY